MFRVFFVPYAPAWKRIKTWFNHRAHREKVARSANVGQGVPSVWDSLTFALHSTSLIISAFTTERNHGAYLLLPEGYAFPLATVGMHNERPNSVDFFQ